jgi:hypothetical protein
VRERLQRSSTSRCSSSRRIGDFIGNRRRGFSNSDRQYA